MAIKIAGTTVIDNSRNIVNATGVGSYILLDTRTLSGATTVDFTQVFDGTYDRYVVAGIRCRSTATNGTYFSVQVYSNNSLITTTSSYRCSKFHRGNLSSGTTGYVSATGTPKLNDNVARALSVGNSSHFNIYINQPNASSLDTHLLPFEYSHTNDTDYEYSARGSIRVSQGSNFTIDGIRLSGSNLYGTVKLYGIK